ncbi:diguanylate cyclase domain-containing protein [Sporomusa aerivorans]|uniref:diguanylate cyclase domain-containing protein n=1 Tax=Sporomusa aerivorans TaxID=204936 RepID=UPI00352B6EE6
MKSSKLALATLFITMLTVTFYIRNFVTGELAVIEKSVQTVHEENVKQLSLVVEAQEQINKVPWLVSRFILSENADKRKYIQEQISRQIELIDKVYIHSFSYRDDEKALHAYVERNWKGYKDIVFQIINPANSNPNEAQDRMEDCLLYAERVNNGMKMIVAFHERDIAEKTNGVLETAMQAKKNVFGLVIIAAITFIFVGLIAYRKIICAEDKLQAQAYHDALTGLPNRLSFEKVVSEEICIAGDSAGGAVVFLDMDNFKFINDQYGHDAGDQFLIVIANRIRSFFNENVFGARFGGDEFVLYLKNVNEQSAELMMKKLLLLFADPVQVKGVAISPTPSIGVAFYPKHGSSAIELLKNADIAMYKAKVKKNSYVVYDASGA